MAMFMIEGFEQIDPTVVLTSEQLQYLLVGVQPDVVSGWFGATDDEVAHNTDGRIDGNCIRFTRGANAGVTWSARYAANMGFSFVPRQKLVVGFAVKYSVTPSLPIPLVVFRYDPGSGEEEQLGIWVTPNGNIFACETDFVADYTLMDTPTANPFAISPASAFRFTQWTYFEVSVNYEGATPVMSLLVNGEVILDGITSGSLQKQTGQPYISSVHFINPTNSHFANATFWQQFDDVYMDDEDIKGPQWIVGLENGAVVSNTGWSGVPADTYTNGGGFVDSSAFNNTVIFALSDIPTNVGTINAIGVNVIASQAALVDGIAFGVNGGGSANRDRRATFSENFPPKCARFVTETPPLPLTMTPASLNSLNGYLRATQIVD